MSFNDINARNTKHVVLRNLGLMQMKNVNVFDMGPIIHKNNA